MLRPAPLAVPCLLVAALTAQAPSVRYLDPAFTPVATTNVTYGANVNPWTSANETLKLDVWEPQGDTELLRPLYVHVHGGDYHGGAKSDAEAVLVCQGFAALGYVAFAIDYRLAPTAQHGGLGPNTCAEDAKAAVRYARANAATWKLDARRVLLGGDGSGGTASLLAAFTSWSGNSGSPGLSHVPMGALGLWCESLVPLADPRVGLALVHGLVDTVVPFGVAQANAAQAIANGGRARVVPVANGGHACWDRWDAFKQPMFGTAYEYLHLWEKSGLVTNPDYKTTRQLALCMSGWETQVDSLFAAPNQGVMPFEPVGTLFLDPATLVFVANGVHLPSNYTDKQVFHFTLPPTLVGTFYAQHASVSTSTWWITGFSNLVRVTLP